MSFSQPPRHGAKVPLDAQVYARIDEWKTALLLASDRAIELREPVARRAWLARYHQVLTLASPRSIGGEAENENLIAWSTSPTPEGLADQFGVRLPNEQIAVLRFGHRTLPIKEWLKLTSSQHYWRGDSEISVVDERTEVHQWAWRKELDQVVKSSPEISSAFELRRAQAADLWLVQQMASTLAQDILESPLATRAEALHWLKAGRLFLLSEKSSGAISSPTPIAMGALSGEFRDPISRRTSARLSLLFVSRGRRGQGVGQQMMLQIEHQLRQESIEDLVLFSDFRNESTNRFYAQIGFRHSGSWTLMTAG